MSGAAGGAGPDAGDIGTAIGFIGPGAMGGPMVSRLLAAGHDVTVWARTPAKVAPLLDRGAQLAGTPAEVVSRSSLVLSCLAAPDVLRAVVLDTAVLGQVRPGTVVVDHTTTDPATAHDLARAFAARGASFLDAPVSGGPAGAAAGTLSMMVGGPAEVLDRVRSFLSCYASTVLRVGETGQGQALKAVNQLLVGVHAVAAAEASALLLAHGIDHARARDVLMAGWAGSTMLDTLLVAMGAGDVSASGARLGPFQEVQALVADVVAQTPVVSELLPTVRSVIGHVVDAGHDSSSLAALRSHYWPP